jgi:hypothetical protein
MSSNFFSCKSIIGVLMSSNFFPRKSFIGVIDCWYVTVSLMSLKSYTSVWKSFFWWSIFMSLIIGWCGCL